MISLREYSEKVSSMWAYELNGDDTPDTISYGSGKEFYWKCNHNPKHIYQKQVVKMFNKYGNPVGCIYCEAERSLPFPGETDLFSICPIAKEMWDFERNAGFNIECIHPGTPDKAWFKCENGHSFQRDICRFVKNQNCPICKELKNVIAKFPHMVRQWNFNKNKDVNINLTSANSKREVWWKCKKCGYEWKAQISSRRASKGECPCCETRIVVKDGVTDLFSLYPELKEEYNYEKNKEIDGLLLSVKSTNPVWWKCRSGHEWQVSPSARFKTMNGKRIISGCPYCLKLRRDKSFADEFPDLAEMYVADKNIYSFDDEEHIKRNQSYWWHCNICNNAFESNLGSMIRSRTSKTKGCSYCSGKKVKRENSFAALHSEVMDEYDPKNEIDPFQVTEKSYKKVSWICRNNPNHRWETSFSERARGIGNCSECRGRKYNKMLYQERPDLEKYFDSNRNKRPFNSYSYKSNEKVWWLCEKGHSFDRAVYHSVTSKSFECPICINKLLLVGENDLKSKFPELAAEFNCDRNNLTPDKVIQSSITEYWWKCKEGHEFFRSPYHRTSGFSGCPICARTQIEKGINDFQSAFPKIVDIWDYEQNGLGPDEISDKNTSKFFFKCSKGHQYESYLSTTIFNDCECLICKNVLIQAGINDLLTSNPELAEEFSPNEIRKPEEFTKDMSYSILWRCPKCSGDYKYSIKDRELHDDSCPYCNRKRPLLGYNSLVDTHPELAKEWSPKNERKAETFTKDVNMYVKWICPTCKGEYSANLAEREVSDDSCPYCNRNKPLAGFNSLIDTHPELAEEWSESNDRTVYEVTKDYSYPAKWICSVCGGEYIAKIKERQIGDKKCSYCNDYKILPGYNSFKEKHRDLLVEWDYINNYLLCDPDYVSDISKKKVWWKCSINNKHQYIMSIGKRVHFKKRKWNACPYCKGLRQNKIFYL